MQCTHDFHDLIAMIMTMTMLFCLLLSVFHLLLFLLSFFLLSFSIK